MSHHISDDTTEFGRASGLRVYGERLGYLIQSSRPPAGPALYYILSRYINDFKKKKKTGGNRSVITDSSVSTGSLFDVVLVVSWLPG